MGRVEGQRLVGKGIMDAGGDEKRRDPSPLTADARRIAEDEEHGSSGGEKDAGLLHARDIGRKERICDSGVGQAARKEAGTSQRHGINDVHGVEPWGNGSKGKGT